VNANEKVDGDGDQQERDQRAAGEFHKRLRPRYQP
jgi:hypothetical protein